METLHKLRIKLELQRLLLAVRDLRFDLNRGLQ